MQFKVTETYTTNKSDMVYIVKIGPFSFRVWQPPVADGTFWLRLTSPGKNGGTAQAQAAAGLETEALNDSLTSSLRMQMPEIPDYVLTYGVARCVDVATQEFPQVPSAALPLTEDDDAPADDSE